MIKPFHFGPDFEVVLEDVVESYLLFSARVEALRAIVALPADYEAGLDADLARCDLAVVKAIRFLGSYRSPN